MSEVVYTKLGDPIELSHQLGNDDIGLFPQVTLIDAAGVELPGSPVDLPHLTDGLYEDDSLNYPATRQVRALFRTFKTAAHTKLARKHCNTIMVTFKRDFVAEQMDLLLAEAFPGQELEGFIEDGGELAGTVLDDGVLLEGSIEDDGQLIGTIEDDEALEGFIKDDNQGLEGSIEC